MSLRAKIAVRLPVPVRQNYRRARNAITGLLARFRTPRDVFSEIYRRKRWGRGEDPFYSGQGSRDARIVAPYVAMMRRELGTSPAPHVVDLGCGDFTVGRQLVDLTASYTAVDVVPELVRHLKTTVRDPRVTFVCLDIIRDPLPPGDVCSIRQVLQHLSNEQIMKILPKLDQYAEVYVTEHYPLDHEIRSRNVDKPHGADIRLGLGSGVYLDAPPFNIDPKRLELVLEVSDCVDDRVSQAGVLRTFRLRRR